MADIAHFAILCILFIRCLVYSNTYAKTCPVRVAETCCLNWGRAAREDDTMVVGIPRALLYYRYHTLWEGFFEALGVEVVTSGPTTRDLLRKGSMYAIDEACLSSKVYLGHVDALIGKCDAILVPRIATLGNKESLCTKFYALYDIVQNTFRDRNVSLLDYNIDMRHGKRELMAFMDLGKKAGRKKAQVFYAYTLAKQAEQISQAEAVRTQTQQLDKQGVKILIVGHSYNVHDAMVGKPVTAFLSSQGAIPILADIVDRKQAVERSAELTDTLPWIFNRELVGAVQLYRDKVDGIILLSTFPCGPDSLVNDIIIRRVKGIPILNLLLDNQEGNAGIETRLESFLDIIQFRKEERLHEA